MIIGNIIIDSILKNIFKNDPHHYLLRQILIPETSSHVLSNGWKTHPDSS